MSSWAELFRRGAIVDVDVHVWSGKTSLSLQDLGIPDTPEVQSALSLGVVRLVPPESYARIRQVVRDAHKDWTYYTVPFQWLKGARYCPQDLLEKLVSVLDGHKAAFDKAVAEFIAEYDNNRDKGKPIIRAALEAAAKTPAAVESAMARIYSMYPPADDVARKFALVRRVYVIGSPELEKIGNLVKEEAVTVTQTIQEMIRSLREELTTRIRSVVEPLAKGGTPRKDTLELAKTAIERVRMLGALGDPAIANAIEQFASIVERLQRQEDGDKEANAESLEILRRELEVVREEEIAAAEAYLTGVGKRTITLEG